MLSFASRTGRVLLALAVAALAACADEPSAPKHSLPVGPNLNLGDVITVTNTSGGTGVGSLRWAVAQTAGGEIIRFAPAIAGSTIVVDSTVVIAYPITIEGPQDKGITISGGDAYNIFTIYYATPSATPTTVRNVALVNGMGSGSAGGGAFLASADVVLENVTLSNHKGDYYAAFFTQENATFINTTISGNTSVDLAAVFVAKKLTLVNSTIAYNNEGGVDVRGPLAMRNSIITHNGAGANCQNVPTFERNGRNLADDTSCGDSTVMMIAPAKLDSLRDNGGPARTHALLGPSPAINAGKDCTVTVDQRYVTRDANCDLGAYEFKDFTTATIANNTSLTIDPTTGAVLAAGSVTCSTNETFDLAVEVSQQQKAGKTPSVVKAAGKVTVACSTTAQAWGIALAPSSGQFEVGDGQITTTIAGAPWIIPATATTPVKLFRGRK
jgi:hypothetical protein